MNQQLLRRAWDALDSFKQAYPENWHEDDEQVMVDLMRADIKMSNEKPKPEYVAFMDVPYKPWVNLTSEEIGEIYRVGWANNMELARAIEQKLKEKNVGTI